MEPHTIANESAIFYTEVLPPKLIDLMVEELLEMEKNKVPFNDAGVGGDTHSRIDHKERNSKVSWWYETHWATSVISHYIALSNRKNWEYDLNMLESLQLSVYLGKDQGGGDGGHYDWHSDYGTSNRGDFTRKLSASVLVTDPSEYEGGDLIFKDYHNREVIAPKEKGTIIVFDSRVPHKVTRVTTGRRVSIVTWMYGPKLR